MTRQNEPSYRAPWSPERSIDGVHGTMWEGSRDRIACVVGTRPEAVKMAPVILELRRRPWADPVVITTGQHGSVVEQTLGCFGIEPDVGLGTRHRPHSLSQLSARLLRELGGHLDRADWRAVVVQGDTSSALAGSLAGFFSSIPVVHVEAGLRSGDLRSPFPEEAHRRMIAQVSSLHLAPTHHADANLRREALSVGRAVVTGNTVIDAVVMAGRSAAAAGDPLVRRIEASSSRLVLVTAHRRENWGEPIARIGRAVAELSRRHRGTTFLMAAHMNPAVRSALEEATRGLANVLLPGPVAYAPFSRLLSRARLVITDSGGIQEEAAAFGLPVLVTRRNTERFEGLCGGLARLVGTEQAAIVAAAEEELARADAFLEAGESGAPHLRPNPYGDGLAAQRCAAACGWLLGHNDRPQDIPPPPVSEGLPVVPVGRS
ncbi:MULTISPECIES: UDP-N-acetylglucosamine 2-epimerase (non-hydrolyzing) [unclassified Streptomyces]|uniref:non-hydrolyzing UDP-N-acetylglucosamine 2-epimerase n=1 Tax=unclassified Streptomyces TaxID=2593676 RepID=UPI0023672FBA|nr:MULTISPECIES: UDP-N-acetylglucosamine 2-epimerase (non-hydrolyzing) [unclassified Streptomyces]MDF3140940.1 UDP-N-acetylglucosamine 2-epimerase (non-hydrolyzing) [Streptomyces sp. T21Q-yed]WDF43609.1 UDP-N-acetylglucosamine 2-epimerase (non-hydrolyzing) [Streptomyces sp. T12]